MRAVLIGGSGLAVATARILLDQSHEVVLIEADEDKIDELRDVLDCGFVHGDGSRPAVLEDVGPEQTDALFCLSNSDQDNIIAALVGRKIGFSRVIVHIRDADFQPICGELDIDDVIIPDEEIGRALADMIEGKERPDLSGATRGGLRFFAFEAQDEHAGPTQDLELPGKSRVIALTAGDASRIAIDDGDIESGDQVLILTTEAEIDDLRERFM